MSELPERPRRIPGNDIFQAEEVDRSRDESWTTSFPVYRVTFWNLPDWHGPSTPYPIAFNAESWRVVGARDLHEVVAWADADGRQYELFAESEDSRSGRQFTGTVLRLTGYNPALGAERSPNALISDLAAAAGVQAELDRSGSHVEGNAPPPVAPGPAEFRAERS
ncbi:hypothetical protein [Gryllotalpicola sp.]|uniref:hypothetical protein n=1 Tax=Gryllotalpicola sp. TaxID=1932787 RepID=UPI002610DAB2|nr:hypothetical protein [Gryllotalpicola sp.]